MKKKLAYITIILTLTSCIYDKQNASEEMPQLHSDPQMVALNIEDGYIINPVTGDSIQPIINSLGDTIITGVPVPAKGKVIHPDSVAQPQIILVVEPRVVPINRNADKVSKAHTVIAINKDSLKTFTPGVDTSSFVLVNSIGDTVPTGVPIPAIGQVVRCFQTQPVKAYPPRMKDDAEINMKYLDVNQGMKSSYISAIQNDNHGNLWFGTWGGGVSMYNGKTFTHYTENEGLNHNEISSILKDSHGNLWFGTEGGGVSMYNGETFTYFNEKVGLSNNYIRSILEDSRGNLWFGTLGGGVSRYNGETFTHFTQKEGLSNNIVLSILEDSNGNLWFGTWGGGVSMYNGETFTYYNKKVGLSNNYIRSILEDSNGNLWFGTEGGGVSMYNGETFTHFTEKEGLSNNVVRSILEDGHGNIWFGTWGGGVSMYNGKTFTHFTEKEGLSNNYISSIQEYGRGNLWFGTDGGGVSIYNGETFMHFIQKEGLSNNDVRSILEDSYGNLWFGSLGGGVSMYNGETFTHFSQNEGLGNNIVLSILEDSYGNLWFCTWGRGVSMYNGETFTHFTENEGLSNNYISSILEDCHGNLWFGTMGGGVSMYNGETFTHFTENEGLSNNEVRSILEDGHGNLWFGTWGGGVSMYNGKTFTHFTEKEGLSHNYVWSLLEDGDGNLWFGTWRGGVSMFNGKTFKHYTKKEGLSNNDVRSILEDSHGNLWFDTWGGGVSMYNGETFTHFTQKEGLSNNYVSSILEDSNSNIWLGTESGLNLVMFDLVSGSETKNSLSASDLKRDSLNLTFYNPVIHTYSEQDGLKSINFYQNSVLLDSKNRIWWGNGKNLTMLDMNNFEIQVEPPSMQLNRIEISEQFADYRLLKDSARMEMEFNGVAKFYNYPLSLELPYNSNNLTFYFSAIDWTAPHKIKYSFKMEGLHDNWSLPTAEAKADYYGMPYGNYTFKVRAVGAAQKWSDIFEYSFTINPPWWFSWWAYTMYAVSILLLIFFIFQWRTAKLLQRQKKLEQTVKDRTVEISDKNEELSQQNEEISAQRDEIEAQRDLVTNQKDQILEQKQATTDSIQYASRIQTAILPPDEVLKYILPKHFILYKPRDIVSGDFYWLTQKREKIIIVVADCTGHGVPGAFMSMLGSALLNDIVNNIKTLQANLILDDLRDQVMESLRQTGQEGEAKDGMDIALCILDKDKMELQYAGGYNPLYLIRKNELIEIKADKMPIGISSKAGESFTNHELILQKGDAFYMFSDGYIDQFGGPKGKKFMTKQFKQLLLDIQNKIMFEQKEILEQTLNEWMGIDGQHEEEYEQIDDIIVMGIKV